MKYVVYGLIGMSLGRIWDGIGELLGFDITSVGWLVGWILLVVILVGVMGIFDGVVL